MSDDGLAGRVALVTGASRGIGAATAARLARDGATVVLSGRSAEALAQVRAGIAAAGGRADAVPADLADPDTPARLVAAATAEHGRLDILVNNAGVLPPAKRTERLSRQEWDEVLAVNLTAPWELACRAREAMGAGGVVVNVTSTAAAYPSVGLSHYCTSKAALTMLTRACALEWARDGIRVLGVAPGKVDTELVRPVLEYAERRGQAVNPLGRVATPEEVADLIAYLVSDRAAYVTGSVVTIDGGEVIGLAAT